MNFTREPIIETIITPKDGYKLIVRSSKASGGEEFAVDAVEVVSFGNALFFRSQERPKSFLVPVSDFEIVEAKETRVVLKSASFERSIKIGGGKASKEKEEQPEAAEQRPEKKRERRRRHRRKVATTVEGETAQQPASEEKATEGGGAEDETPVSSSLVSRLIPPPSQLISDKWGKDAREAAPQATEGDVLPEPLAADEAEAKRQEKPKRGRRKKSAEESVPEKSDPAQPEEGSEEQSPSEPPQPSEGGDVSRVSLQEQPETMTTTSFSIFGPFSDY